LKRLDVTVTATEAKKVEETFEQMELLYTSSAIKIGAGKFKSYSVLLPDELVDKAVEEISNKIDLRLKENTLSVYKVESCVSTSLSRLTERVAKNAPPPNPLERLLAHTDRYTRLNRDLLIMSLFAALIALVGLFLDNVALIIGAMLLSPLLGPINAFAVNASLGRFQKLIKSELAVIVLLVSVIALSAVATFIASNFVDLSITNQIAIRNHAALTDILIALVLGFAAGLALFIAIPEILVGISIAVALVPPAAVAGIGIALLDFRLFIGAFMLTLVYLFGLQLGCTVMLRIKGVSPRRYYQKREAKIKSAYSIVALSLLLIILTLLVIFSPS